MHQDVRAHPFPARPTLTPVFICSLAFWATCSTGYSLGKGQIIAEGIVVSATAGLFGIAFAIAAIARRGRLVSLVLSAACVGLSLGSMHAVFVHQTSDSLDGFSGSITIELLEDSSNSGFGESALVRAQVQEREGVTLSARFGDVGPLLAGQRFACRGKVSAIDYERNRMAWTDGSSGILKADALQPVLDRSPFDALVQVRGNVIKAIGCSDDGHRLLQALICGYRREIRDTESYAAFQTCGLAHLVAVSGAHLVIVTGLFATVLRSLRSPRRLTIAVLVTVMATYFVMAGMPVSALRASVMAALGLFSFFGRRRASSLNAVGVGVFVIVGLSPSTCLSASFALSGLSTAGIVLFAPLFQAWFNRTPLARARLVSDSIALTLSAGLLSQPYACSLFSQLPLISPIANAVTTPLFPLMCGAGFVSAAFEVLVPQIAGPFTLAASWLSTFLSTVVRNLAYVPYASIPISLDTPLALAISLCAALFLWASWPRRARYAFAALAACGACIVAAFALSPLLAGDRIVMLDVGQGDAILLQSKGETMLIDTGNQDTLLLDQLGKCGLAHIGTVLVSHADDDHCGSLDALRKAVVVDRVAVAQDMLTCESASARALMTEAFNTAADVVGVRLGDSFHVGAFSLRVVWPKTFTEGGGNADSLCVIAEYDGDFDGVSDFTALMTGDAEKEELRSMIDAGAVGDVDLLKVGHHGSRNGSTLDEMETLNPEIALISCGAHNRYGHPTQETLDMLDSVGAATFRTDLNGQVRCLFTPGSISVEYEKEAS